MNTNTDSRYSIVKLPGKNEGWAIFDVTVQATVVGSRSKTRREAQEAADEMGITISKKAR